METWSPQSTMKWFINCQWLTYKSENQYDKNILSTYVDKDRVCLKLPFHAFPVITCPLVCYEGFYACKRCAVSKPSKYTL